MSSLNSMPPDDDDDDEGLSSAKLFSNSACQALRSFSTVVMAGWVPLDFPLLLLLLPYKLVNLIMNPFFN